MKKWLILGGVIAVLVVCGYLLLSYYAVKLVEPYLRKRIGSGLTISEVTVGATCLSAKGIRYDDPQSGKKLLQIEEVRVYPSLRSLLTGHPRIMEFSILQPVFYVFRSRQGEFLGPLPPVGRRGEEQGLPGKGKGGGAESVPIVIDKVRIEGGSVDFKDEGYGEPPVGIELSDVTFQIEEIHYPPVPSASPFELKGKMKGRVKQGGIEAKGWINLETADTQADFKVHGIEVKTFEPYYRKRVSAEIESGYMDLEARIELKKRLIDAPGMMELADLRIKEEGTVFWVPAKILASLLKNKGNRIRAKFRVKGNLDDPKFDLQETLLTRLAFSLGEALGLPVRSLGEAFVGGAGKGADGLSEGLRSLGDIFRKSEKKE